MNARVAQDSIHLACHSGCDALPYTTQTYTNKLPQIHVTAGIRAGNPRAP